LNSNLEGFPERNQSSNLQIIRTEDGSDTLFHRELNQHYHSVFGAVQESRHIFIETGLFPAIDKFPQGNRDETDCLNILEIGFGTGLNALLTLVEAEKRVTRIHYTTIEAFPLEEIFWQTLNYPLFSGSPDYSKVFAHLHKAGWNQTEEISPFFTLHKIHGTLEAFQPPARVFNLVYFDAFGPETQPELWTEQIFRKIYQGLAQDGILVTYSVKGTVVRALKAAGFLNEKLPGPPGKRHILRATKM
jgi:tRNA U34 5-methylaminomethyl-2-thiouridine-forming methyltransferase MnmC